MQSEDAEGRLHAIGRVDSKEGTNIIIVQFYLTADSQAGNPAGLQRSACHICQKWAPAVTPEGEQCLLDQCMREWAWPGSNWAPVLPERRGTLHGMWSEQQTRADISRPVRRCIPWKLWDDLTTL